MINFDKLPTTNTSEFTPVPDVYLAHIEVAEMRQPKDTTKPPYLNLQYRLTRHDGKKAGVMFDKQVESEKHLMKYKLARFVQACGIPLKGQMELKDLATLVQGKDIVVDTSIDESGSRPSLQVDVFKREMYYPKEQFDEIWKLEHPDEDGFMPLPEDSEVPDFMNTPEPKDGEETVEY